LKNFPAFSIVGIEDAKVKQQLSEDIAPPPIHIEINDEAIDAMKCVNMLGETTYSVFHAFLLTSQFFA
jgi:hypothetical protein